MAALSSKKLYWYLVVLINICGLYASLSRGPFVGFVAMALVMIFVSRDPLKNLMTVGVVSVLLAAALLASPFRDKFIGLIPFYGEVDDFNVTYRQQLLTLGYDILLQNPFLGASDFFYSLEDLRQGEGIIDIVNSYLLVALSSGLIGLTLFCGCLFLPLCLLLKELGKRPSLPYEQRVIVITVVALTVASSIIIFTVSSILTIPLIYWSLSGLSIQICQAVYRETRPNVKAKTRQKKLVFS
jgi:O-antigen ligase